MLRVATRTSALARWQAGHVAALLDAAHPGLEVRLVPVETTGDRRQDLPVWELGGQGVFVKEVQAAVLDGRADVAVHSAKDLPSASPPGLRLASVPPRGDVRDALVGAPLEDLAPGATVATGSLRRQVQLAERRPDLVFAGLRGNIATRLSKVPPGGAVVVAAAALDRLGLAGRAAELLDSAAFTPQVAQGALGVECRDGDDEVAGLLAAIEDPTATAEVRAERAYLARRGGGCDLPVGALARVGPDGTLTLRGLLARPTGPRSALPPTGAWQVLRGERRGEVAAGVALGRDLADELLAAAATGQGAGGAPGR